MSSIAIHFQGKEYRPLHYALPREGEHFVMSPPSHGIGHQSDLSWPPTMGSRLIVEPVPVRYTLGDKVFEETGEVRLVRVGDFALMSGQPHMIHVAKGKHPILRLVDELDTPG